MIVGDCASSFGSIASFRIVSFIQFDFMKEHNKKIRNYHHFKRDAIHFICKEITFQPNTQKELTRDKKRRRWTEQICSGCWLVLLLIHLKLIAVDERNYLIAAKPILRTTAIYIEFNRCVCCLSNLRLFTFADLMWHNNTPSLVVLSFRGAAQKPFYIFSCIVRF